MPWKVGRGTKLHQKARVPHWVKNDSVYAKECLRGLLQTDGSIYEDRDYRMVNFTNHCQYLAEDVFFLLQEAGFQPTISKTLSKSGNYKYCVRVARDTDILIRTIKLHKT